MRKSLRLLAITVVLLLIALGSTASQANQLRILNDTGYFIFNVYVSSSDSEYWGKDRLGAADVIAPGSTYALNLARGFTTYDIMLIDSDGDPYVKYGVRANATVRFTIDDLVLSQRDLLIINDTGYPVYDVYAVPSFQDSWGGSWLRRDEYLPTGHAITIPIDWDYDEFDFKLVDSDGDAYYQWNVNVDKQRKVLITFADFEQAQPNYMTIKNNTGYTIWFAYAGPSNDPEWGDDLLYFDEVVMTGDSFVIVIDPEVHVIDIQLVDSDGDVYIKWGVPVINNRTITFTLLDIQ